MDRTATIHPTLRVQTVTVPVNAPSAMMALWAIRDMLGKAGRKVTTGKVVTVEPKARPFAEVAIDFPGSSACYIMRVEYTKDPS